MSDTDVIEELHGRLKDTLNKTLYVAFSRVIDADSWEPAPPVILRHVEYMDRIERDGTLFAAGPFVDESGARLTDGLVIVRAEDATSATRILEDDPFHAEGYRTFELMRWQLNQGRVGLQLTFSNQRALFE
jgi:uncharacterized protein YciI